MSARSVCDISCGQMHELAISLDKAGFNADLVQEIIACRDRDNEKARAMYAAIRADGESTTPTPLIRVDRSISPVYPAWMREVVHPELEKTGPGEYDIKTDVEQWLHDGQENGGLVKGQVIYDHFLATDTLQTCLGLRDLEEIQKKGVTFFQQHFQGKAVFAWKSVVRHQDGYLRAPYLCEGSDRVLLGWYWLERGWYAHYPALRFASAKV
jgi:hypothetical protein